MPCRTRRAGLGGNRTGYVRRAWTTGGIQGGHLLPRHDTFADSDGDGVGDLRGLIGRLDYLARLGVSCLWLNPIHPSPGRDDGYDVTDYYNVDPRFGTSATSPTCCPGREPRHPGHHRPGGQPHLRRASVVRRGARRSRIRRTGTGMSGATTEPADRYQGTVFPGEQTRDLELRPEGEGWYYHRFYDFQPDLNCGNPAVRAEINKIMCFWLQLGWPASASTPRPS